ncbi:MAG: hypothetical protein IH851_04655 [Armatimonadetes bacterium]|nr:hypothetical protein [Armatimonadota bacterium]
MRKQIATIVVVVAAFGLAAGLMGLQAANTDPAEAVKELNALRAKTLQEARESGTRVNLAALNQEIETKAQEYCKGVDATKVQPKQGLAWAQLFVLAKMQQSACDAALRYLTLDGTAKERFEAQMIVLDSCRLLDETEMLFSTIKEAAPGDKMDARNLGLQTAYYYADQIAKENGVHTALVVLADVEARIPYDEFTTESERPLAIGVKYAIVSKRADLLMRLGQKEDALGVIEALRSQLPEGHATIRRLNSLATQLEQIGETAPALHVERSHGKFRSLDAWKGRVILIDFFAHW